MDEIRCPYCGNDCHEEDDYVCDGFSGDIDGLWADMTNSTLCKLGLLNTPENRMSLEESLKMPWKTTYGFLKIINSRIDVYGNRRWAFCFTQTADENRNQVDGEAIEAKISGGDSNIYALKRLLNGNDSWDNRILVVREEMKIRDFDRYTKKLPYAGCKPEEINSWLRLRLKMSWALANSA